MREKPQLTASEYLGLAYGVSRGVLSATWAVLTGWSRGEDGPPTYGQHVVSSMLRSTFPYVSVRAGQAFNGTTVDQYRIFVKKNGLKEDLQDLDSDGLQGCWIGREEEDKTKTTTTKPKTKTLVWFHGGGYVVAATPPHFEVAQRIHEEAKKNGLNLRVLLLAYDLAPHQVYPEQLRQAVLALKFLLGSGVSPSDIIIGGDSAGGNLTLELLLHLSHPHKDVPPLSIETNLAGALLVSPWVSLQTDADAFKRNARKDFMSPQSVQMWGETFQGKAPRDKYNHPLDAPAEDWKGVKVDKLAVVAGTNELLIDDIRAIVEKFSLFNSKLEYLEAKGEGHDAMLLNRTFGFGLKLETEEFSVNWVLKTASES